jgi:8-oxo-dGTP diphosphatase
MTPDDARVALASVGLSARTVVPIGDGWASWTFDVDGEQIAQFPRNETVARGHARTRRLLPELARHVTFSVPVPTVVGEWDGRLFQVYDKLDGEPLRADTFDPAVVASMLGELHTFSVDRARALLGDEGTVDEWRRQYELFWTDVEAEVLPLLSESLRETAAGEYAAFLRDVDFEPALVHRDLGVEHILVGEAGLVAAMLDFEEVAVGDPAIDFVGLFNAFGLMAARAVLEHYRTVDPEVGARMRFYRWMGSVHAVLYARGIGDDRLLAGAIEEIERRITDRPRACAAVVRGDHILMVRYLDQFWTLPGGGIDPGEASGQAALRELREEAGIGGAVVRELYQRTYGQGSEVCYLVESDEEPFVTDDPEISDVRWVPLVNLEHDAQVGRVSSALRGT